MIIFLCDLYKQIIVPYFLLHKLDHTNLKGLDFYFYLSLLPFSGFTTQRS